MGSRHNRKRVRSRPRYRNKNRQTFENDNMISDQDIFDNPGPWNPGFGPAPIHQLSNLAPGYFMNDFQSLHSRTNSTTSSPEPRSQLRWQNSIGSEAGSAADLYDTKLEEARMQMFGGEHGDEVGLCGDMLRVVMGLFDGNVDYED